MAPLDIIQDVVDQAQLVYFKVFDKIVRREVVAQNALKKRLEDIGYLVEDEVKIASQILEAPEQELDRVDLLVDRKVVVELKLTNDLSAHENQLRRYMKLPQLAAQAQHGVLIGFPKKTRPLAIIAHSARHKLHDMSLREYVAFESDVHPSLEALKECLTVGSGTA